MEFNEIHVGLLYANTLEQPLVLLEIVAVVALFVGLLALANAVWSSRIFPRWTAVLIAVAPVLAVVVDYGFPYLLLVVAWGWIGWKMLRMSPAEWASFREAPAPEAAES